MGHILNPTTTHFTGRKEYTKVTNPHAQATGLSWQQCSRVDEMSHHALLGCQTWGKKIYATRCHRILMTAGRFTCHVPLTRGGAIGFFSAKLCHTEIGKLPQSDACCNQYTGKPEKYRDESPLSCVSQVKTLSTTRVLCCALCDTTTSF
jgi:hypothetical protein